MRLNITAMSMASGLLWGASILIIAAANLIWPSYFFSCAGPSFLVTVRAPAWARSLPGRSMRWWMASSAERSLGGSTIFSRRVRRNSARRGNSSPALMWWTAPASGIEVPQGDRC